MRPIPATMRDQTEFLPLGPPIRAPRPLSAATQRSIGFELFEFGDASHEAPDAAYDQCTDEWVHRDHLTVISVDMGAAEGDFSADYPVPYGKLFKGEVGLYAEFRAELAAASRVDAARALNRIEAAERVANPSQAQSPELTAALESAQRAMMAHFFGAGPQVEEGPNGPSSATGMMLLQEQAGREMNKALRGRALDLLIAPSNPDRWNNDELRRKLGLGQIS